ncbi:18922_t:CDS:1 [Racocetra persica]|uniref:18922_t:CDS:1 n=1 Tax=Racocetra persica TaxID=160502 RepID=A0ACA9LSL3_9GLOM|nr:18922_t:CDS:1 [Racocetra persica]
MIDLLHSVLEATEYLSGSSYPMISNVHLTVSRLIQQFDHFIDDRSHLDEEYIFADFIHYKLNKYWSLLDEKIIVAAILDPSSKIKTFLPRKKRTVAITSLRQEILCYKPLTSVENINLIVSKNKKAYFKSFFLEEQETKQLLEEELDLYLSLPTCQTNLFS